MKIPNDSNYKWKVFSFFSMIFWKEICNGHWVCKSKKFLDKNHCSFKVSHIFHMQFESQSDFYHLRFENQLDINCELKVHCFFFWQNHCDLKSFSLAILKSDSFFYTKSKLCELDSILFWFCKWELWDAVWVYVSGRLWLLGAGAAVAHYCMASKLYTAIC